MTIFSPAQKTLGLFPYLPMQVTLADFDNYEFLSRLCPPLFLSALPFLYFDLLVCWSGYSKWDDQLFSPPGNQAPVKKASQYRNERQDGLTGGKRVVREREKQKSRLYLDTSRCGRCFRPSRSPGPWWARPKAGAAGPRWSLRRSTGAASLRRKCPSTGPGCRSPCRHTCPGPSEKSKPIYQAIFHRPQSFY